MSPTTYSVRALVKPSDVDLEKALSVLNAAYSLSEPALYSAVGPEHLPKILPALNAANLKAAAIAGEIYVAEDASGAFLGVALGFGPGHEVFDSEDQTTEALSHLVAQLPSDVHEWFQNINPLVEKFRDDAFGGAARTRWTIQRMGILPDHQRKGIGSAIMEYVCKKSIGLTLQAMDNKSVEFYRKLGFQVKASVDLKGPHGAYTLTALLRDH